MGIASRIGEELECLAVSHSISFQQEDPSDTKIYSGNRFYSTHTALETPDCTTLIAHRHFVHAPLLFQKVMATRVRELRKKE